MTKRPSLVYEKNLDTNCAAVICQLKGKLIGGSPTFEFLEDVREELANGTRHVILDLAGVNLVNSTGVGVLAALYTSTQNKNGKLVLVGVDDNLQRILEVVQIWGMVDKAGSIEEAAANLCAG